MIVVGMTGDSVFKIRKPAITVKPIVQLISHQYKGVTQRC
jgi:hypothetical protein